MIEIQKLMYKSKLRQELGNTTIANNRLIRKFQSFQMLKSVSRFVGKQNLTIIQKNQIRQKK